PAYADLPDVCRYLDAALQDIIESGEALHATSHSEGDIETTTYSGAIALQRYLVNLLVAHPTDGTRPVIYEDHPTLQNLLGRIEHMVHMGTLISNFTLIRAGALHRANGGFLLLDAVKVLSQPYAWEGLKRCLKSGSVRIESLSDLIGLGSTVQLEPEPMPLDDLMREAGHFAATAQSPRIERDHVEAALSAHRHRNERMRQRWREDIVRGQILVDTVGEHIGQINGLAVAQLGESSFAHPVRITATVRAGEGEVIDIEREVKLGGPLHSKGVMILSAFLAARFGWRLPLSLKASLVFAQSYGGVEGDSASLAELAALLSALGQMPLRQTLAVTGSVNQFGVVQAVGGINEKIEGFFDICAARGLHGDQGVLIPASNVCHLMLKTEVVEAVRAARFRVWPVASVDEAMELLTGLPAGQAQAQSLWPEGSVNARVLAGLEKLAQLRHQFGKGARDGGGL
ncbi:MAG: AAA family ATPase, partial [Hylemonella sp.]|nr:AAA family ATPase [Hylemonella sp.]